MKFLKKTSKNLYNIFPFKKEFFLLLKKVWNPQRNISKYLHFRGIFDVEVEKNKSFKIHHYGFQVENEIFWEGLYDGWEGDSMRLWVELCKISDVILDIGANTGVYALTAKVINPNSKVFAFEPIKRVYSKLNENIELNNFDIKPFEKAVSNKDGMAVVYDLPSEHIYSVTVNKNLHTDGIDVIETQIETITLSTFINQENLSKIDLMKIDVETHEPEVFEGFGKYLQQFKPPQSSDHSHCPHLPN